MKTNWKTIWKQRANEKANDATDHYQYCILKAFFAKSNNKIEIAQSLLRRAFTPENGGYWNGLNSAARFAAYRKTIFGMPIEEFLDNTQKEAYFNLVRACQGGHVAKSEPTYLFIFVRQDLSPEQQAVQAAHVTYKAGQVFKSDPDTTHFVLIGLPNEFLLASTGVHLYENDVAYVEFREEWLDNSLTAIASEPIKQHRKRFLKHYPLLRFE